MKCTTCGQEHVRVLETRERDGVLRRRRECPAGHRWYTVEVPETVVTAIGRAKVRERLAVLARGIQQRVVAAQRRAEIQKLLAEGWKPDAIAHHLNVTGARVRQLRKELWTSRP